MVCHGHPRSSYLFADSRDCTLAEERSSILRAARDGIACDHIEPVPTESLHQTSRLFNLHIINPSSTHVRMRHRARGRVGQQMHYTQLVVLARRGRTRNPEQQE
jgi:hypothetical protein